MRNAHTSPNAPSAVGPYSHGVWAGDLLFLSGQVPIDPTTSAIVPGGVAEQTKQVFKNLKTVLADADLSMDDIVKCNVFLTTMDDFAEMNAVYGTHVSEPYPARSTIAVAGLPLGSRLEIELVALRPAG